MTEKRQGQDVAAEDEKQDDVRATQHDDIEGRRRRPCRRDTVTEGDEIKMVDHHQQRGEAAQGVEGFDPHGLRRLSRRGFDKALTDQGEKQD